MQYLQAMRDLLFDNLLFTIYYVSAPLVDLTDGYEIGELGRARFAVCYDSNAIGYKIGVAEFAKLLLDGL